MSKNTDENNSGELIPDEWLIRSCDVYDEEYSDCRSIKARFNQYFIHGETLDCTPWKHDADNCYRWANNKDLKAANQLIQSEKNRRKLRLKAHFDNKVWEKRTSPPEDWSKPLPEYMQKEYENSYLNIKNKEMKGEIEPVIDSKMCSIM